MTKRGSGIAQQVADTKYTSNIEPLLQTTSGVMTNLWLYWSATFIGTSIVALVYWKRFNNKKMAILHDLAFLKKNMSEVDNNWL